MVRVGYPIILGLVIDYFSGTEGLTYRQGCLAAAGVCFGTALHISLYDPNHILFMRLGMRLRIACCTLIYKKVII